MKLKQLLEGFDFLVQRGSLEVDVLDIECDSRLIKVGGLFISLSGQNFDGNDFLEQVIKGGASSILSEKECPVNFLRCEENINYVFFPNIRKYIAKIVSKFYDYPQNKMKLIGITGTNGKTSSTFFIKQILEQFGCKVGLIGTINHMIGSKTISSYNTTPDALVLIKLFDAMVKENIEYVVMEVSSHALSLGRVSECEFSVAGFTNLTQDHLDFHGNLNEYFEAKCKLFGVSKVLVLNVSDSYSKEIFSKFPDKKRVTYGEDFSDFQASEIKLGVHFTTFDLIHKSRLYPVKMGVIGKFSVYNLCLAISVVVTLGYEISKVVEFASNVTNVKGRVEKIETGRGFDVVIDYAHTPDGLYHVLSSLRASHSGRIVTIFGCGGNRDTVKRPLMGKIVSELSDFFVVTSDNPRKELPSKIIDDILKGVNCSKSQYVVIENRKDAIEYAVKSAKPEDLILIAGKGHEEYQILESGIIEFDERKIVSEILKSML